MAKQFIHPNNIEPDKYYHMNGVLVNEYLIKDHNINDLELPAKRPYKLRGVTIHNTYTLGKDDDGKWYSASTVNGNMGGVFVHYYVSDSGAWKNLPDDSMNWSCSDGVAYAGGNAATIALEVIMNGQSGANNEAAMDNAARIAAYILYKNGLTANDLYTHSFWINTKIYGMTGDHDYLCTANNPRKKCPVYIIPQWDKFKRLTDSYIVKLGGKSIYNNVASTPAVTTVPATMTETLQPIHNIYKAVSSAAIRSGTSKSAVIYSRAVKGYYYLGERTNGTWFKHIDQNAWSMLKDGDTLFEKVGEYKVMQTTAKINVRSSASTSANKMAVLNAGTKVYVWDATPVKSGGYTWQKIILNGTVGFVAGEYLK